MKKIISLLLTLCMLSGLTMSTFAKEEVVQKEVVQKEESVVQEILEEYHEKLHLATNGNSKARDVEKESSLKYETIEKLTQEGYVAYDVNKDTFKKTEEMLNTNFETLNLKEEYSYILILDGGLSQTEAGNSSRSSAGTAFDYTYNGVTYRMRYLTVTAADDPAYSKASSVNLLKSKVKTAIQNCLDTAIIAAISAASKTLGTVASICGLSISNFGTVEKSILDLYGGSNWTRVFTQVYDNSLSQWMNGSCVEYVTTLSYISGMYYSASSNSYVSIPQNAVSKIQYSPEYSDTTWRKQKAVDGFNMYWTQYDTTGSVKYKYGGTVKITHNENF